MNSLNPGNRPLSLAGHLRNAASLIETGAISYSWKNVERCNCGVLVRSITGMTSNQLSATLLPYKTKDADGNTTWRDMVGAHCPLNPDMSTPDFFRALIAAGMRPEDFGHLEYLSHPDLMETRRGLFGRRKIVPKHRDGSDVSSYMLRWASLIEQHHAANPQPATEEQRLEAVELRPLVEGRAEA
jgi:hypothetical protein